MRKSEVAGVKGKGEDGRAHTREVKLGCVFTQTTRDEEGNPVRDPQSTRFNPCGRRPNLVCRMCIRL